MARERLLAEVNASTDWLDGGPVSDAELHTVLKAHAIAEEKIEPELIAEFYRARKDRRLVVIADKSGGRDD